MPLSLKPVTFLLGGVALVLGVIALVFSINDSYRLRYIVRVPLGSNESLPLGPGVARLERRVGINQAVAPDDGKGTGQGGGELETLYIIEGVDHSSRQVSAEDAGLLQSVQTLLRVPEAQLLSRDRIPTNPSGNYVFLAMFFAAMAGISFINYRRQKRLAVDQDGGGGGGESTTARGSATEGYSKDQVKELARENTPVSFAEIAGIDEAKLELTEVIDFLKDPDAFTDVGAEVPRGVLLYGPPGNGKTLLARAIASEAGVPFLDRAGSDFVEMYVGVGAGRVRSLFKKARELADKHGGRVVIFIDEVDSLAHKRGSAGSGEHDHALTALLTEMDGVRRNKGVVVIGATNRLDVFDEAALRPGRFTRHVHVPLPDRKGRRAILDVHRRNRPFEEDLDWDGVAKKTSQFSGAQLANLINEASILAARARVKIITSLHLHEAYLKVLVGHAAKRILDAPTLRRVALHEVGHALVQRVLRGPSSVESVSIIARGQALGLTVGVDEESESLPTEARLKAMMAMAIAGRVAEDMFTDDRSAGAADDLVKASAIARQMVMKLGMSPRAKGTRGLEVVDSDEWGRINASLGAQARIDRQVHILVEEAYEVAQAIIEAHRVHVEAAVTVLVEEEVLDGPAFEQVLVAQGGVRESMADLVKARLEKMA